MNDHDHATRLPQPSVLYLGTDAGLPHRLRPLLDKQGLALHVCPGFESVQDPDHAGDWGALVLDTAVLGTGQTIQTLLYELAAVGVRSKNLVVIAHEKDIQLRLQALRAGAAAFFVAPVGSGELAERLHALCRPGREPEARVLVVDDDQMQSLLLDRILCSAGYQVRTLCDALQILEVLDEFRPEIILMDLNMPDANGAELTAIIREQEAYATIPILFVSSERDPARQIDALSMGGDAFITKPIMPELLVKAVSQRMALMRSARRRLRLAEHTDPGTGLATRRYFISRLERAIAEPDIGEPGNALVIVALDGASRIDERTGTAAADLVRERIGRLIAARLESGDLGVRLDHHRHALLLRRHGADALLSAAEALREAIAATPMTIASTTLNVSASLGIGLFQPPAGDAITLVSRAAKACAEAQAAGGNSVRLHRPFVPGPGDTRHEQRIMGLIAQALSGEDGQGRFHLFYQPLIAVQSEGRHLMETHLRLVANAAELIPDADYLAVAERGGRLRDIDRWVMSQAITALAEQATRQPELTLVVPQHLDTLTSDGWVLWFRNCLVEAGLTGPLPIIALGIGDLLERPDDAAVLVRMLRKLGVEICLRDVDVTTAAMDLVVELAPPLVKIAARTTKETPTDRLHRLISRLRLGGAEVIVGGVDDPAQVSAVWTSGASYVQGSLIHEPLPHLRFDWSEVALASDEAEMVLEGSAASL